MRFFWGSEMVRLEMPNAYPGDVPLSFDDSIIYLIPISAYQFLFEPGDEASKMSNERPPLRKFRSEVLGKKSKVSRMSWITGRIPPGMGKRFSFWSTVSIQGTLLLYVCIRKEKRS